MPSHVQQAIAENQRGHFEAALAHAEAAIGLREEGVKPYLCAAFSAAKLVGDECALGWVEQGLARYPDDCLALCAHASLLRSLHRPRAALESNRRWARLEPDNAQAHLACARDYTELRLFDPAITHYTLASQLASHPAPALTDLSILLYELGRRDEAAEMLNRALAADGDYAAAWYTRAEAKRFLPRDPDIEAMRRLLDRCSANLQALHDTTLLHYALAKAHADLDDRPQAMVHLRAGSALKRATLNYDPLIDERFMALVQQRSDAAWLERLTGAGLADRTPIFIVGMPRSGTSLLEQILASHPAVVGGGESGRMQAVIAEAGESYPACLQTVSRRRIGELAAHYLESSPAPGAARITDKTPYNFLHLGLIHAMFPEARIIHCRRDTIDTCVSIFSTWFASGNEFSYDTRELVRYYAAYTRLMEHWRAVLPAHALLEIDYERLVENFTVEAPRVVQFCGLPWEEACLDFHLTKRPVQTASKHQVREPLYRSSIGRGARFGALADELRREFALSGAHRALPASGRAPPD